MSEPRLSEIFILLIILLVPALTYALVRHIWNQPLRNGQGYFLGVEVPVGFYEGPGRSWLKSYHATVAALYLVWAVALGAIVVSRRWEMTPVWGGGFALLFVPIIQAFAAWARHKLGANPPVRPVALALESRRFGDYISWPLEALAAAVVAFSWWLLLRSGPLTDWMSPLILTWMALGLLPGKMAVVRFSYPLPVERTEEHYQYQDAERRNWLRVWGAFGWFFIVILLGGALRHAWSPIRPIPALQWFVIAAALAVWGYSMIVMFRGMLQLRAMSSNLRPAGSWRTPFRRSPYAGLSRAYLIWFTIWFGGILVSVLYSFR
jgi:hypothetical protein